MQEKITENNNDEGNNGSNKYISPEAEIAGDVTLGEYVKIGPGAVIEAGCEIEDGVEIRGKTIIGSNNYIARGALLGFAPQHLGYEGQPTKLIIGSNNYIGPRATLHRGTEERGHTLIGDGNYLAAYSHIAHDCLLADNIKIGEFSQLGGHVEIGSSTIIEAMVGLHQFVMLGRGTVITAQAKVNKDVPPYLKAGGHPARLQGTGNCPSSEVKLKISRAFELLCRSDCNTTQAVEKMQEEMDGPIITEFITFLQKSERGVCR